MISAYLGFSVVCFAFLSFWVTAYGSIFADCLRLRLGSNKEDICVFIIAWGFVLSAVTLPFQVAFIEIK